MARSAFQTLVILWACVLSACSASQASRPDAGGKIVSIPAPAPINVSVSQPDANGIVTVTGADDSVEPGYTVEVTNCDLHGDLNYAGLQTQVTVVASQSGAFMAEVFARQEDEICVVQISPEGERSDKTIVVVSTTSCDEEADADLDGFANAACGGDDCDDTLASVYPTAVEICDGQDNDCDGLIDAADSDMVDDVTSDADDDGYFSEACGGDDCNDNLAQVYPGGAEICDGKDNDCDGLVDATDPDIIDNMASDGDNDGHFKLSCLGDDCDDTDNNIFPGADEICDGTDNDCDEDLDQNDSDFDVAAADQDDDGDLPTLCGGSDCDDADASLSGLIDNDGDTYATCPTFAPNKAADCDDGDAHVFPEFLYTSGPEKSCQPIIYPGLATDWHFARVQTPGYFSDPTGETYYIFFTGDELSTARSIGYVSSSDAIDWGDPVGPVLQPDANSWDVREISHPWVAYIPGEARPYLMLYSARDAATSPTPDRIQIGMATATSPTGPWEKKDMDGNNVNTPVLGPSADPNALDNKMVAKPTLYYDGDAGEINLWYVGRANVGSTRRIFHATSNDGVNWVRTDTDGDGPDVILEPEEPWEGNVVNAVSWVENPASDNPFFDLWFAGNADSIGYLTGDATNWTRSDVNPVLIKSPVTARFDGNRVVSTSNSYIASINAYYFYYEAETLASNDPNDPNYDPIYGNLDGVASYIGFAINWAPKVKFKTPTPGTIGPNMTITGTIRDSAPDRVTITVTSDLDGALGNATITAGNNLQLGRQQVDWSLDVVGLSSGTHQLTATAVDEAGITRTRTMNLIIP